MKHTNYSQNCHIIINKFNDDIYRLEYPEEHYSYICSKSELLEELSEHLDNMKGYNEQ